MIRLVGVRRGRLPAPLAAGAASCPEGEQGIYPSPEMPPGMQALLGELRVARDELAEGLAAATDVMTQHVAAERALNRMDRMLGIGTAWSAVADHSGCGCECSSGGFCGGCGHAGCGRR